MIELFLNFRITNSFQNFRVRFNATVYQSDGKCRHKRRVSRKILFFPFSENVYIMQKAPENHVSWFGKNGVTSKCGGAGITKFSYSWYKKGRLYEGITKLFKIFNCSERLVSYTQKGANHQHLVRSVLCGKNFCQKYKEVQISRIWINLLRTKKTKILIVNFFNEIEVPAKQQKYN